MLRELFPRMYHRFTSLPILGTEMERFVAFLTKEGYPRTPARRHVRTALKVDVHLRALGCRVLAALDRGQLRSCAPPPGRSQADINASATVRLLERFLDERGILRPPPPPGPSERLIAEYASDLKHVRGLSSSTIKHHVATAARFLGGLEGGVSALSSLSAGDIESFVCARGKRLSRESLQHVIAHLRSFLRYLASQGDAPAGLDHQIDTPRVYRAERLPRALPWETVQRFLASIDRTTALGRRDYAMFMLIVTYGLRACEVVTLRFEDIDWKMARLNVPARKTAASLLLPLTDGVGDSMIEYLRTGRPDVSYREIFVRHRAPVGILKPTAIGEAFQRWSRRSDLGIPCQGPHCLRHSLAVHLLRQGVSLKTIGDLLGHRDAESTCVYLRLNVDDLREVALPLPGSVKEVAS